MTAGWGGVGWGGGGGWGGGREERSGGGSIIKTSKLRKKSLPLHLFDVCFVFIHL